MTKSILIRIGLDELEELKKMAQSRGITVNGLIRMVLYAWIRENKEGEK